jgi:hypothetical protein
MAISAAAAADENSFHSIAAAGSLNTHFAKQHAATSSN